MGGHDGKLVLVTGGAGFIGSHLAKRLLELGANVRIADDFSRGSEENIEDFRTRVSLCRKDLTILENCMEAAKGVDCIYHLAASVGGIHYITKHHVGGSTPSLLMNTNMLEAARRCDVKRFLFASSACVYRQKLQSLNKFKEEDAYPANPLTTYGWAKLMGEIQCESYYLDYGIKSSAVRIFNCYGENENLEPNSAHVIPSLIRKAVLYPKEEFRVFGDGKQERAFLYVRDCVEGLIRCMDKLTTPEPLNLGSEELVSIGELAASVVRLSGKSINVEYDETGPQGTQRYCADTTRMREKLDWVPPTSFEEGLRKTYDWVNAKLCG